MTSATAIITMGSLPKGTLAASTAALVLAVPVTLNTLFKGGVAISIAGWRLGRLGALPLLAVALLVIAMVAAMGWTWRI